MTGAGAKCSHTVSHPSPFCFCEFLVSYLLSERSFWSHVSLNESQKLTFLLRRKLQARNIFFQVSVESLWHEAYSCWETGSHHLGHYNNSAFKWATLPQYILLHKRLGHTTGQQKPSVLWVLSHAWGSSSLQIEVSNTSLPRWRPCDNRMEQVGILIGVGFCSCQNKAVSLLQLLSVFCVPGMVSSCLHINISVSMNLGGNIHCSEGKFRPMENVCNCQDHTELVVVTAWYSW